MAHQRILKSEFFTDYDVAQMPPLYRLFFQGLWCQADRRGSVEDKPQQLKTRIMPYDNVDPVAVIDDLVARGFVVRYRVNGKTYLSIRSWAKNQSVNKNEKHSELPDISKADEVLVVRLPPTQVHDSCTTAEGQLEALPVPAPSPVPVPVPTPDATSSLVVGQLRERLEAAFRQIKGVAMTWNVSHENDLRQLHNQTEDEVVRRWLIALETPYPRCSTVRELVRGWDHYATAPPSGKPKPDVRKGYARADEQDWSGDGGYGELGKKAGGA